MFFHAPVTNKAVYETFTSPEIGNGWVKFAGKDYYYKKGVGTLETYSGELMRYALGPEVITEMLPVINEEGKVIGILSEKITNGVELVKSKDFFPELGMLTIQKRLDLKVGCLAAAIHALNEQDGNVSNIFVRQLKSGKENSLVFSLIDGDRSLGQVFTSPQNPLQHPELLSHITAGLPPDVLTLVGGYDSQLIKMPLFLHQVFLTYLMFALLDDEKLASLAQDHFLTDPTLLAFATTKANEFVGMRLRDILIKNAQFAEWLVTHSATIQGELSQNLKQFNAYKTLENPKKYKKDFISYEEMTKVVEQMRTGAEMGMKNKLNFNRAF